MVGSGGGIYDYVYVPFGVTLSTAQVGMDMRPCAKCGHSRAQHRDGLGCHVSGMAESCDCKRYLDPDTDPYAPPKSRRVPLFMPKGLTEEEYRALVKPDPREPYKEKQ